MVVAQSIYLSSWAIIYWPGSTYVDAAAIILFWAVIFRILLPSVIGYLWALPLL